MFIVQSSQVLQLPVAAGCKGKRSRCVFIEGTVPFCLQSFFFLTFIILFLYLCKYIYMYILPYTFISHLKLSQSHLVNKPGSSSSRARSNNLSPFTPGASEQGALTSSHVFLLPGPVTALFGHSIRQKSASRCAMPAGEEGPVPRRQRRSGQDRREQRKIQPSWLPSKKNTRRETWNYI